MKLVFWYCKMQIESIALFLYTCCPYDQVYHVNMNLLNFSYAINVMNYKN